MKSNTLTLSLVLSLSQLVMAAERELHIPVGSVYEIQPGQSILELDRLVIGNAATIRFAKGVTRWTLRAQEAVIGNGVRIDGRGVDGAEGIDGRSFSEKADVCDNGAVGERGLAGADAHHGVAIKMALGVAELGSLTVLSDGGKGGIGGRGGPGQAGGEIRRCRAGHGGAGGDGGSGGSGGNGGDVEIQYWTVKDGLSDLREAITVSAAGGMGGVGGVGGAGGEASEGQYLRGSGGGPGGKKWLAGGKEGRRGQDGAAGRPGQSGHVQIAQQQTAAPLRSLVPLSGEQAAQNMKPKGQAYDVPALLHRIEALEARVRRLEKESQH